MIDVDGKLKITDTTLRDGEQAPGVVFRLRDRLRIAAMLDELGVDEVELGTPAQSRREVRECRILARHGFKFTSSVWCRATRDDIAASLESAPDIINISFPVSDILLEAMDKDRIYLMFLLDEILTMADRECPRFSVGLQDAGRADPRFLETVIRRINASRAFRLRLADTVGILNPMATATLIKKVKAMAPRLALEFHGHNDLGMATANTLCAARAGTDYLSVTVNGLGERTGNCPLENLLFALKYSLRRNLVWNGDLLMELCRLVAELSNRPIPAAQPVTGAMATRHESGIHVRCLLHDPTAYSPFPPDELGGRHHEFVLGKHSGIAAVNDFFRTRNIRLTPIEGRELLQRIKIVAGHRRRTLTEPELLELYYHDNSYSDIEPELLCKGS